MATKAKSETPVSCVCGNPIYPYVIGEHHYQPTRCPACISKEKEAEEKQNKEAEIINLGLYRRYLYSDFDNLHEPKPSEDAINACRGYAETIRTEKEPSGKGIYLWGPNGTGKTHLAVAIARHYGQALFVNTLRLFDDIKQSYTTGEPCDIYEGARWARLIILDDLGSERPTEWVQERLYSLLSGRYDEMLSTVYTSNYDPDELWRIIGKRSASRVLGSCLTVKIDGPDHRQFDRAAI